jgi:hypothetical protein
MHLVLVLLLWNALPDSNSGHSTDIAWNASVFCGEPIQELSPREKLIEIFSAEIGERETGGNNRGPAVKKYLASVNLGEGFAWCAAFVKWCFNQIPVDTPNGNAWSPSWFPESKTVYKTARAKNYDPRPGDVFGIYYNNLKRIGHVGFIVSWDNTVITVEGNTNDEGSREGDGVYRKKRLKRQIYAVADWIGSA